MIGSEPINYIDFERMEKMCHPVAVALFDSATEPMTQFQRHDRGRLEAALNSPRQTFDGKDLYPTLARKAAVLYYGLNKSHAFENGNKRTATASLLVFLYINNRWLRGDNRLVEDYLVNLAARVASSEGNSQRDELLAEIEQWLEAHMAVSDAS